MIVPSVFLSIDVIRETSFNNQAIKYINDIQESTMFENIQVLSSSREYQRKERTITMSLIGRELKQKEINYLKEQLLKYGLKKTNLIVKQTGSILDVNVQADFLENLLNKKEEQLVQKDSVIKLLETQLDIKTAFDSDKLQIAKEMAVQYPCIQTFSIERMVYVNTENLTQDTILTLFVNWNYEPDNVQRQQLTNWLKVRLGVDRLKIID
jgi:hypothetical protein